MKNMLRISALAAVAALAPVAAFAQRDVGGIAESLADQTGDIADLVSIAAFVIGVGLAIAGLLKFRAHSQNPNDQSNKMSTAFMLVFGDLNWGAPRVVQRIVSRIGLYEGPPPERAPEPAPA